MMYKLPLRFLTALLLVCVSGCDPAPESRDRAIQSASPTTQTEEATSESEG